MPRVHYVKKARKDNPAVKAGEPYYWWKFRYGGKRYSKTRPLPSQLTQSEYLSTGYSLQECLPTMFCVFEDLENDRDEVVGQLEQLRDMSQESLDNMPQELQDSSDTGMLLQERVDNMESLISRVQDVEIPDEDDYDPNDAGVSKGDWEQEQLDTVRAEVEEILSEFE